MPEMVFRLIWLDDQRRGHHLPSLVESHAGFNACSGRLFRHCQDFIRLHRVSDKQRHSRRAMQSLYLDRQIGNQDTAQLERSEHCPLVTAQAFLKEPYFPYIGRAVTPFTIKNNCSIINSLGTESL